MALLLMLYLYNCCEALMTVLTDAPPKKTNRAGFLQSDRIKILDLPQDGRLPRITKSIQAAIRRVERLGMSAMLALNFWILYRGSTKSLL